MEDEEEVDDEEDDDDEGEVESMSNFLTVFLTLRPALRALRDLPMMSIKRLEVVL